MSDSIERYNDDLCYLIIHGYAWMYIDKPIIKDIGSLLVKFICIPSSAWPYLDNHYLNIESNYSKPKYTKIVYQIIISHYKSKRKYITTNKLELPCATFNYPHTNDLLPFHYALSSLPDRELVNILSFFVQQQLDSYNSQEKYKKWDKFLNIVIKLSKRGAELKYKNISKLIAMYEYYYFEHYVLKPIKDKLNETESTELLQSVQKKIPQKINDAAALPSDFEIDFKKWSNDNAMKMASLLQVIMLENKTDVENMKKELNEILDFVRAKYMMINTEITRLLESEVKTQTDIINNKVSMGKKVGKVVLGGIILTYAVPVIIGIIVGCETYSALSNDPRTKFEVADTLMPYFFPWTDRENEKWILSPAM